MEIEAYREYWSNNGEKLYLYLPSQVDKTKIGNNTFIFLTTWGLPSDAAPFLSFREVIEGKLQTPNQVLQINLQGLNNYLMFGSNGSGDPICIDARAGNQIVYLNHDDYFAPIFINSTLMKLGLCLTKYRDFIINIIDEKNEEFSRRKFTDNEYHSLQNSFVEIDNMCLADNSFWAVELDSLLWERDNE